MYAMLCFIGDGAYKIIKLLNIILSSVLFKENMSLLFQTRFLLYSTKQIESNWLFG